MFIQELDDFVKALNLGITVLKNQGSAYGMKRGRLEQSLEWISKCVSMMVTKSMEESGDFDRKDDPPDSQMGDVKMTIDFTNPPVHEDLDDWFDKDNVADLDFELDRCRQHHLFKKYMDQEDMQELLQDDWKFGDPVSSDPLEDLRHFLIFQRDLSHTLLTKAHGADHALLQGLPAAADSSRPQLQVQPDPPSDAPHVKESSDHDSAAAAATAAEPTLTLPQPSQPEPSLGEPHSKNSSGDGSATTATTAAEPTLALSQPSQPAPSSEENCIDTTLTRLNGEPSEKTGNDKISIEEELGALVAEQLRGPSFPSPSRSPVQILAIRDQTMPTPSETGPGTKKVETAEETPNDKKPEKQLWDYSIRPRSIDDLRRFLKKPHTSEFQDERVRATQHPLFGKFLTSKSMTLHDGLKKWALGSNEKEQLQDLRGFFVWLHDTQKNPDHAPDDALPSQAANVADLEHLCNMSKLQAEMNTCAGAHQLAPEVGTEITSAVHNIIRGSSDQSRASPGASGANKKAVQEVIESAQKKIKTQPPSTPASRASRKRQGQASLEEAFKKEVGSWENQRPAESKSSFYFSRFIEYSRLISTQLTQLFCLWFPEHDCQSSPHPSPSP